MVVPAQREPLAPPPKELPCPLKNPPRVKPPKELLSLGAGTLETRLCETAGMPETRGGDELVNLPLEPGGTKFLPSAIRGA